MTSLFHKHSETKDRRMPYCKECAKANAKKHYYYNPHKAWANNIKKKFGITAIQYYMMLDAQGGKCAICRGTEIDSKRNDRMPVDHCHSTGRVRGILCTKCNRGIGLLGENCDTLRAAIEYLS